MATTAPNESTKTTGKRAPRSGPRRSTVPAAPGNATEVDLEALRRDLYAAILAEHPGVDLSGVEAAFELAVAAHDGQRRATGEPYVTHPIASAQILAELGIDTVAIQAALLHDVPGTRSTA